MSNIEVHQCSRFCLGWFLFALSHLLFIIIDRNCPLSKVLCRIIIQVGHQKYFLGPLYVTLSNWLWQWLWQFSHNQYWLSPILTTHSQYHVLQYYFHDELKSGLHFWHSPAPWFTKVMWSLSIVLAWDSDRWLTSNFLHTTLQRRSNSSNTSYTEEGNLIREES